AVLPSWREPAEREVPDRVGLQYAGRLRVRWHEGEVLMRVRDRIGIWLAWPSGPALAVLPAILLALVCAAGAASAAPARVVSMNVCTDQMAMLVAADGQLRSVTHLATDPQTSAMVDEAKAFPVNHGLAEEIFLMRPDLVLAGTYTAT